MKLGKRLVQSIVCGRVQVRVDQKAKVIQFVVLKVFFPKKKKQQTKLSISKRGAGKKFAAKRNSFFSLFGKKISCTKHRKARQIIIIKWCCLFCMSIPNLYTMVKLTFVTFVMIHQQNQVYWPQCEDKIIILKIVASISFKFD